MNETIEIHLNLHPTEMLSIYPIQIELQLGRFLWREEN